MLSDQLRDPVFNPLWRRIAMVAVSAGWTVFDAWQGNTWWAVFFGALTAYTGWHFLVVWEDQPPRDRDKTD